MSGSVPALWLDRVAESLREHEDRRASIQAYPPRYEVLGEISRGGMGIVYRAWDPQLGRNVALKVLRAEEGRDAGVHERFQREATLAASLHHPHIVQIFDTGTWNGQNYIAMQLIEGEPLDQARPDRKQALACIRDAARAIHYAHERGIVHRDIKPANLLLDREGRVYVTDFGIARQAVVSSTLTSPGTVVGTPAYMSPEQAQGLATDARSDVYSLGATLYELVTGRPPFDSEDPLLVVEAVRSRDPDPPRKRAPDLSKNVESILVGAMERVCEDRYATAAELADDIDRYLKGERPSRRSRGLSYRVRREFVRHPGRSAAVIVFCLLLLGAGVMLGFFVRGWIYLHRGLNATDRALQEKYYAVAEPWFDEAKTRRAQLYEDRASAAQRVADAKHQAELAEKEALARKAQEDLKATLADFERITDETRQKQVIDEAVAVFQDALTSGSLPQAQEYLKILKNKAPDRYPKLLPKLRAAQFEAGLKELDRMLPHPDLPGFQVLFQELSAPDFGSQKDRAARLAPVAHRRALALKAERKLEEAISWFGEAEKLGMREAALNEQRGLVYLELQKWDEAQRDMNELLARRPDPLPPAPFAQLPYRKGKAAFEQSDWPEAIAQYLIAVKIDPRHGLAYHDGGIARFRSLGLAREALEGDLKKALAADPALVPDPLYREIAVAYAKAQIERYGKSEDMNQREGAWRETLAWLKVIGKKAGDNRSLALERARMDRRLRDFAGAFEELEGLPRDADVLRLRGQVQYSAASLSGQDQKGFGDALKSFEEGLALNPKDPVSLYWRGTCRHVLQNYPGAIEDLSAAAGLGLNSPDLFHQLSRIHLHLKDYPAAVQSASAALERLDFFGEDEFISTYSEGKRLSRREGLGLLERDTYYYRANARFYLPDYRGCTDDCSRVLAQSPAHFKVIILRGEASCRDNRHTEAQRDFAAVIAGSTSKEEKDDAARRKDICQGHSIK